MLSLPEATVFGVVAFRPPTDLREAAKVASHSPTTVAVAITHAVQAVCKPAIY